MAKKASRRWTNWRVSADGQTIKQAERAERRRKTKHAKLRQQYVRKTSTATARQMALIRVLCDEVGGSYPSLSLSVHGASEMIDGLLSRKRRGLLGRAAGR